jgi:hypothetical protein
MYYKIRYDYHQSYVLNSMSPVVIFSDPDQDVEIKSLTHLS